MDKRQFWRLIEDARQRSSSTEEQVELLREDLCRLSWQEVSAFDVLFNQYFSESYSWNLWGAAYLIRGGCSDDGFDYFRGWLITQGQAVFEAALKDPDSLADFDIHEDPEQEEMLSITSAALLEAQFSKTSGDGSTSAPGSDAESEDEDYVEPAEQPTEPSGEDWDFEDMEEMKRRYPRLYARYSLDSETDTQQASR